LILIKREKFYDEDRTVNKTRL